MRLRDIPFRISSSFFIIVGAVTLMELMLVGIAPALNILGILLMVFGLVTLHEYGHAWAAIKCGLRVDSITLWLLGGVARIPWSP